MNRCEWAKDSLSAEYHDKEWGVPVHDDKVWFEFITLEGAQAGLSWLSILKRREGYRVAFDNYDLDKIINYDEKKIEELRQNERIIRNKLKIKSVITNAVAFKKIQEEFGSFDKYIWKFTGGQPLVNNFKSLEEVPVSTEISDKLSKDLKKRGFKFLGTTICYALMQATGLVNDHTEDCFRYDECKQMS